MNTQDYKKIAEIMYKETLLCEEEYHQVIKQLADYFEEVDVENAKDKCRMAGVEYMEEDKEFCRKQFLKDCGVEE